MTNPDIFISYNREDAAIAQLYADSFTAAGLVVWWDATLRSGEDYDAVTEQALRTAKSVVVLWSPRSVNSRWVRAEATIADRGQRLMPVMIESCDRPIMFELKQTADLSHWRGDRDDKDWLSLVADVRRKIGLAPGAGPGTAPEASAPAKSEDDRAAVAVLPFGCRAGDDELALQAEDLTEDVTRELAYNRYFRVIAAGTMAAWRGKAIDHKEIGQKLKARYLVEGKLQRSGGNNRLTVQLVDGGSGNVLWSTRVLADLGDTDMSADALGAAVAAQLAEQILQRVQALAMARSAPYSAWDHILRSAAFARRADEDGARLAVEEAKLAVAAGPEIGLAHATLASTLAAIQEAQGLDPDQDQTREIQARTRQAMRLDGNNPTVLMALAGAYRVLGDYEICLRLAKRSVELWPSSPISYMVLGDSYRMLGRTADAIEAYHKQERLAPFDSSRHLALTYLGMCLVIEDQVEEAEIALDRALTLDPENAVALGWKAIAAERLSKNRIAQETVRQIRSSEAAMLLDRHVLQIEHNEHLRARTAGHLRTLALLRGGAGAEAVEPVEVEAESAVLADAGSLGEPVAVADAPGPEAVLSEDAGTRQLDRAEVADETVVAITATVEAKAETPEPPGGDAADPPADRPPEPVEPAPLMFAAPPVDEASPQVPDSDTRAAEAKEYLVDIPDDSKTASADLESAYSDSSTSDAAPRKAMVPRFAALAGAVALAGAGAVIWGGGADQPASTAQAPAIELAALPTAAAVAAGPVAATSTAPHPLTAAIAELIAASRSARRPQAELGALEAGQQKLTALLAQSTADPANVALAGQLNAIAAGLVQQQGSALSLDADRWFKTQEQAAVAARRQLTPEGAAIVDRALNKARGARADLAAATTNSASASDAMKSLAAARLAVARYGKLVASPVAPAIASARSVEVNAGRLQERLSRSRAEIETARVEVGRQSVQVAGLAAVEKPGLFASTARRESFKLRKANAERARTVAAEADRIASQSAAITDPGELKSSLSRLSGLKSQLAELLAASNAALKSAAEPDKKATATEKK